MMLVVIGVAMFVLGVVVERVGRKLGTVLAVLPSLVYFGFIVAAQRGGDLDSRVAADLALALLVGVLAFQCGLYAVRIRSRWKRRSAGRPPSSGASQ